MQPNPESTFSPVQCNAMQNTDNCIKILASWEPVSRGIPDIIYLSEYRDVLFRVLVTLFLPQLSNAHMCK